MIRNLKFENQYVNFLVWKSNDIWYIWGTKFSYTLDEDKSHVAYPGRSSCCFLAHTDRKFNSDVICLLYISI